MKYYDITLPLSNETPVYPGDPVLEIMPVQQIERGDVANLSRLIMSSHCGTHVDAPRHFLQHGAPVDRLPLDVLIGPARVVEIMTPGEITAATLKRHHINCERLLLKTHNSRLLKDNVFSPEYTSISEDAASFLVEIGVRLVGIDYLSIERLHGPGDVHRTLLGGGVVLVEGLELSEVPPGNYHLMCLPLRIVGGDGAPARAILVAQQEKPKHDFDPHTTRWPLS